MKKKDEEANRQRNRKIYKINKKLNLAKNKKREQHEEMLPIVFCAYDLMLALTHTRTHRHTYAYAYIWGCVFSVSMCMIRQWKIPTKHREIIRYMFHDHDHNSVTVVNIYVLRTIMNIWKKKIFLRVATTTATTWECESPDWIKHSSDFNAACTSTDYSQVVGFFSSPKQSLRLVLLHIILLQSAYRVAQFSSTPTYIYSTFCSITEPMKSPFLLFKKHAKIASLSFNIKLFYVNSTENLFNLCLT